jgi:hypothetical protein
MDSCNNKAMTPCRKSSIAVLSPRLMFVDETPFTRLSMSRASSQGSPAAVEGRTRPSSVGWVFAWPFPRNTSLCPSARTSHRPVDLLDLWTRGVYQIVEPVPTAWSRRWPERGRLNHLSCVLYFPRFSLIAPLPGGCGYHHGGPTPYPFGRLTIIKSRKVQAFESRGRRRFTTPFGVRQGAPPYVRFVSISSRAGKSDITINPCGVANGLD